MRAHRIFAVSSILQIGADVSVLVTGAAAATVAEQVAKVSYSEHIATQNNFYRCLASSAFSWRRMRSSRTIFQVSQKQSHGKYSDNVKLYIERVSSVVLASQQQFNFKHIVAGASAFGRGAPLGMKRNSVLLYTGVIPRVASQLGASPVSDVTAVHSPDTFSRTMYAGNAVCKVSTVVEFIANSVSLHRSK